MYYIYGDGNLISFSGQPHLAKERAEQWALENPTHDVTIQLLGDDTPLYYLPARLPA